MQLNYLYKNNDNKLYFKNCKYQKNKFKRQDLCYYKKNKIKKIEINKIGDRGNIIKL